MVQSPARFTTIEPPAARRWLSGAPWIAVTAANSLPLTGCEYVDETFTKARIKVLGIDVQA